MAIDRLKTTVRPRRGPRRGRNGPVRANPPPARGVIAALAALVLSTPFILTLILSTRSHGAAPGPPPPEQPAIGEIASVEGVVRLCWPGAGEWAEARAGAKLAVGDRVRTGPASRASIALVDGTRLSVGDSTEVELTRFLLTGTRRSAVYTVAVGKVRAVVGRFTGRTDVEVRTPTSVAGVKGTGFIVLNRGGANVYFGLEGTALVSGSAPGAGPPAALAGGTMTENAGGGRPISPVTVEPGSPLEEARSVLAAVTALGAPDAQVSKDETVEWGSSGRHLEILSRWNINYSAYLSDSGRFDDALDVLLVAFELTGSDAVRAEARLSRGTILATSLGDPEGALAEFMAVLEGYPLEPFRERALFSSAVVYAETGEAERAVGLFRRYLEEYPEGGRRATAEAFMRSLTGGPPGGAAR